MSKCPNCPNYLTGITLLIFSLKLLFYWPKYSFCKKMCILEASFKRLFYWQKWSFCKQMCSLVASFKSLFYWPKCWFCKKMCSLVATFKSIFYWPKRVVQEKGHDTVRYRDNYRRDVLFLLAGRWSQYHRIPGYIIFWCCGLFILKIHASAWWNVHGGIYS